MIMKTLLMLTLVFSLYIESNAMMRFILNEWKEYKDTYGKRYNDREDKIRMELFWENKLKIIEHNEKYERGETTYRMGINNYTDWLFTEIETHLMGLKMHFDLPEASQYLSPSNVVVPDSIDWRNYNYVTPVKNQLQCGSCWAFSAIAALEGQHAKKTGALVSLSEQNLVDCDTGDNGCNGGFPAIAYLFILHEGGVDTEASYPYVGYNDSCKFTTENVGATVSGYVAVPRDDEGILKETVGLTGPISVCICVTQNFLNYNAGVFYDPTCTPTCINHAVTIVGYGVDPTGGNYWIVKNSWGDSWGENGYIRMARDANNNCGIATVPIYPLV